MALKFDFGREPERFLTAAYVAALSLIAVLTLYSHHTISGTLEMQRANTETLYTASRQRTLAQDIVFSAFNYDRFHQPEQKKILDDAIFKMEAGQRLLTRDPGNVDQVRPMSPDIAAIYFAPPYKVDKETTDFLAAAKSLSDYQPDQPDTRRAESLNTIMTLGTGGLKGGLDRAMFVYEDETLAQFRQAARAQSTLTFVIILILLMEAAIIFYPLVRGVRRSTRQLHNMAMKDMLTGLNNRRAFMEQAKAELARGQRYGSTMCAVICDIDHFKSINDAHGHGVGDKVIKSFSATLLKSVRPQDLVGRIGGEEFAILLTQTDAARGQRTVERIRKAVEKSGYRLKTEGGEDQLLRFTASFGLIAVRGEGPGLVELLNLADKALYEAKQAGRNRTVVAQGSTFAAAAEERESRPPMWPAALQQQG